MLNYSKLSHLFIFSLSELPSKKALCQVDECSRFGLPPAILSSSSSSLGTLENKKETGDDSPLTISCVHVESCLTNTAKLKVAQALTVKHSVLNAMSISADWKHTIWLRARKNGPLAQRVSDTTVIFLN